MEFNVNKVKQYFVDRAKAELVNQENCTKSSEEVANEDFEKMPADNFNIRSIFSLFDKNSDGVITRNEFNSVSETDYNTFVGGLKKYNTHSKRESYNNSIWSYIQIEKYLNDHVSNDTITEDEVLMDNLETFYMKKTSQGDSEDKAPEVDHSGTHGFQETFDLKDISQMSDDEILSELKLYAIVPKNNNRTVIENELIAARKERAKNDIGSDSVDGHIGTFVQNKSGVCTVLAQIGTMSDEEIGQLFVFDDGHDFKNPMIDKNGKKYWNIKFPIDKDNDKIIQITEDEIKSGKIEVEEYGKNMTIIEFPEGDGDVTAIAMAFVKRFGSEIVQKGEWAYVTKNRFTKPDDAKYKDNQHLEMITDYKSLEGTIIGSLNPEELARKGFNVKQLKDEDLSWIPDSTNRIIAQMSEGFVYTLSDGQRVCITRHGAFFENGTKFEQFHAMEIRRYDEKTNELLISGNEFNNMSELRLPIELLQFCETASLPGTPGVDKTPQPDFET